MLWRLPKSDLATEQAVTLVIMVAFNLSFMENEMFIIQRKHKRKIMIGITLI